MVARKPVQNKENQTLAGPPYPSTPTSDRPAIITNTPTSTQGQTVYSPDLTKSPAFQLKTLDEARSPNNITPPEDEESGSDWDTGSEDEEDTKPSHGKIIPDPLKVGSKSTSPNPRAISDSIPTTLRPGTADGGRRSQDSARSDEEATQPWQNKGKGTAGSFATNGMQEFEYQHSGASSRRRSSTSMPLQSQSHNPYLRMQTTGGTSNGLEDTSAIWNDQPPSHPTVAPPAPPAELPTEKTPIEPFSKLSLHQASPTPSNDISQYLERPLSSPSHQPQTIPTLTEQATDAQRPPPFAKTNPWSQETSGWTGQAAPVAAPSPWDDDVWQQQQSSNATETTGPVPAETPPPELPPRRSQEQAPPKPPRPQIEVPAITTSQPRPEVETPQTKAKRQRSEHYPIKHINWYDASSKTNPRRSPILIQNANGPCPLLALVNALVLSTPAGMETALVETLRTREQVSLGLLLDAVFDELMSGRRGDAAQELPDVGDLYAFLVTLHTGMNVNPRFVSPPSPPPNYMDANPEELSNVHPALRDQIKPGGFEHTREMRLYSTFNVPLIHGWLPPGNSPEYLAFSRSAKTFEDAQNIQFREEELEEKLQASGLNKEEQQLFEDIATIRQFLAQWGTQLTDYGLEIMRKCLKPGQIAILFRNDHFSTLYKEPRSQQLVTLVTDAGYSTHDEIVWESLVDVNGQGSELFSGDFRPVGNSNGASSGVRSASRLGEPPVRSLLDVEDNDGWETVDNRRGRSKKTHNIPVTGPGDAASSRASGAGRDEIPTSPTTEQEDHDLALALQLQEEEEENHRREQAARRRHEESLSEQVLEQERTSQTSNPNTTSTNARPPIPPRTSNHTGVHRPENTSDDAPPPPYEQAAASRPYIPPDSQSQSQPQRQQAPPRQQSAYAQQSTYLPPQGTPPSHAGRRSSRPQTGEFGQSPSGYPARRRQSGGVGSPVAGRPPGAQEEKCVVM